MEKEQGHLRSVGSEVGQGTQWRYTTYDGRVTQVAEREARVAAFARGDVDYFLGNPAAGGTGVDGLQDSCALAVYYSNSFNREIRWQSEGRIQRRGQKSHVGIIDLVSPGTVDELFLEAFASTEELANMVMKSPEILTRGL
jgi:SNF2 family DNA or RNA helicase